MTVLYPSDTGSPEDSLNRSSPAVSEVKPNENGSESNGNLLNETGFQIGKKRRGGPPRMLICYICGEGFGSASLAIHEPQCLKKWDARNEQLPKGQRQPRPVKPE